MKKYPFILAIVFAALNLWSAAGAAPVQYATVSTTVAPGAVTHGSHGVLSIKIAVQQGFHINSNKPADPMMYPTSLVVAGGPGISVGQAQFPKPVSVHEAYSDKPMLVYKGVSVISVPFTVAPNSKPGVYKITGTLKYQGCNAAACFPPKSIPVDAAVVVK